MVDEIRRNINIVKSVPLFFAVVLISSFLAGIKVSDWRHNGHVKALEQDKAFHEAMSKTMIDRLESCQIESRTLHHPSTSYNLKEIALDLSRQIDDFVNNHQNLQNPVLEVSSDPQVLRQINIYMDDYNKLFKQRTIDLHREIIFREAKQKDTYYLPIRPSGVRFVKNDLERLGNCLP